MTEFKRKIYKRGSSFETTIPMPILFALDKSKKHNIIFKFDTKTHRWYIEFESRKNQQNQKELQRFRRRKEKLSKKNIPNI